MARDCIVRLDLGPGGGAAPSYVATGSCGETLTFGVSQVLGPGDLPEGACERFRGELLRLFGPGGRRRVEAPRMRLEGDPSYRTDEEGCRRLAKVPPPPPEPQEGIGLEPQGLGRLPQSSLEDDRLEAFLQRFRVPRG